MASSILPAFDVLESRVLRVPAGDVYENMEEMGSTSRGHYGSTSSQSSVPDPPSAYVDPFLSVWELLWYINGINDLVKGALEKMEKGVFAYNSIFFLKVVLDLQAAYLPLRPPPPSHAVIEFRLVVRIAEVISGRLARRDKETNSLSRELQLRTLVAALSLLDQYDGSKVENDIYVRLLQDVSEMDWDNRDKYINHQKVGGLGSGNYEYLVRYACDLVRKVPSDNPMPPMPTLNSQGIHFLLAAGFVNQQKGVPPYSVMEQIFIRISTPPSAWHKDMRDLVDGVSDAISLQYQSQAQVESKAAEYRLETAEYLAAEVTSSIIGITKDQLTDYGPESDLEFFEMMNDGKISCPASESLPGRESAMTVYGLLDLLVQLVAAFPNSDNVVYDTKELALRIIRTSNQPELRFKAFELIITSTTGYTEAEYYDTMRNLEAFIVGLAEFDAPESITDEYKELALLRVEELKKEKRAAMDRYGEKLILYKRAIESLQRRVQDKRPSSRQSRTASAPSLAPSPSWERMFRAPASISPVPSKVPTWSVSGESPSRTPAMNKNEVCIAFMNQEEVYAPETTNEPTLSYRDLKQLVTSPGLELFDEDSPLSPLYEQQKPTFGHVLCVVEEEEDMKDRPLSFQRGGVEVLQVSPDRRKYKQLPAIPIEDDTMTPESSSSAEASERGRHSYGSVRLDGIKEECEETVRLDGPPMFDEFGYCEDNTRLVGPLMFDEFGPIPKKLGGFRPAEIRQLLEEPVQPEPAVETVIDLENDNQQSILVPEISPLIVTREDIKGEKVSGKVKEAGEAEEAEGARGFEKIGAEKPTDGMANQKEYDGAGTVEEEPEPKPIVDEGMKENSDDESDESIGTANVSEDSNVLKIETPNKITKPSFAIESTEDTQAEPFSEEKISIGLEEKSIPEAYQEKETDTETHYSGDDGDNDTSKYGERDARQSLELPLQGLIDEDFSLPIQSPDDQDTLKNRNRLTFLRRSMHSPIPVDTEISSISVSIVPSSDGADAPEPAALHAMPAELLAEVPPPKEIPPLQMLKKKPSRTSRILASLPGAANVRSISGSKRERIRFGSLRISSPVPRVVSPGPAAVDRSNLSMIAANAPEVVPSLQPLILRRSQTGPDMYNEKMELLRRHTGATTNPNLEHHPAYRSESVLSDRSVSEAKNSKPEYDTIRSVYQYKLTPKECSFAFLTADCRHVIYMTVNSFQIYAVPSPFEFGPFKVKYNYHLGEHEGLKRGKSPWSYIGGAASGRYVVTITNDRVQVHDLQQACRVIYSNTLHGYELRSVAISADKLALGLGSVTGTDLGMIRIFKKNGPSHPGPRWEEWKDIHLPVPPCDPQNPPHLLSLSWDGKFLTACTPNTGYFFAWDLFTSSEPSLISSGRVGQETQGTESLTGAFLFPDNKHILCSTCSTSGIEGRGCFTEPTKSTAYPPSHHPIRHVGLRIHHSAVSPNGNATAYLSKTGQIYIVPVVHIEGDDNVTSLPSVSPKERLQPSITAETAGRILFSPEGDKLIGIDRKGKVLILHFKKLLTESR